MDSLDTRPADAFQPGDVQALDSWMQNTTWALSRAPYHLGCIWWINTRITKAGYWLDIQCELLGFDVWFCLFVAVCSAVTAVHVCVYALHVLCACYASAMCVGQIHKRGLDNRQS